jgi:hypothetical protein
LATTRIVLATTAAIKRADMLKSPGIFAGADSIGAIILPPSRPPNPPMTIEAI